MPAPVLAAARRLSCGVLLVALCCGLLAPDLLRTAGPALLVAAGLLGLPHGAVDHLAWGWANGSRTARPLTVLLYGVAAASSVAVALLVSLPALLVLLALAAAHFAEGEVAWARLLGRPGRWASGAGAGLAAVALPLLLRPGQVRPLLASLDPGLPGLLLSHGVRTPLLVLTAVVVAAGAAQARHDRGRLAELALVVATMVVLPPLAAFAAWFAGWHAVRHTARLLVLDPRGTADGSRAALRRFARDAAGPTAAALVGVVALAVVLGTTGGTVLALLALTVPHSAVVARLGSAVREEPEHVLTGEHADGPPVGDDDRGVRRLQRRHRSGHRLA